MALTRHAAAYGTLPGLLLAVACSTRPPPLVQAQVVPPRPPYPAAIVASPTSSECAPSRITCGSGRCLYANADFNAASIADQSSACASGSAGACTALGERTALGEGLARDDVKARELLDRGCALKDAIACVDASKIRHDETLDGWTRRCREGIGEACLEAGNVVRFGPAATSHPPSEGALFYEQGCKLGVGTACVRLAFHYGTGLAVPKDDARMAALFDKGCRCGDATGCSGLAFAYREGRGVPQDLTRARDTFTTLCDHGVQASCVHLGEMYERGSGVALDVGRAHALFEKACSGRNLDREGSQGCYRLGVQYRDGVGGPRDEKTAFTLFDEACQLHQPLACGELGLWFRDGRFVTKNTARALELLDNACNHGSPEACHDATALRATP